MPLRKVTNKKNVKKQAKTPKQNKPPKKPGTDRRYTPGKMGNPAVTVEYEDARENAMINRDIPTMKNGGEAKSRGMGAAIKGGKFQGVF